MSNYDVSLSTEVPDIEVCTIEAVDNEDSEFPNIDHTLIENIFSKDSLSLDAYRSDIVISSAADLPSVGSFSSTTAVITLKGLHAIAKQNLINSTQEYIAQQLLTCIEANVHNDNEGERNDYHDNFKDTKCSNNAEITIITSKDDILDQPTKQKAYVCSHEGCNRQFMWPAHFKYHQLAHLGKRPYQCSKKDCGKNFYTAQSLMVHMRSHTGEKPFVCPENSCNRSFTTAGNLKNHMRIHKGERPFICTMKGCSKKFVEYSSLKKHQLVHSGEKPFICNVCNKAFSQSGSRNVHRRRCHRDNAKVEENVSYNTNIERINTCIEDFADINNDQISFE